MGSSIDTAVRENLLDLKSPVTRALAGFGYSAEAFSVSGKLFTLREAQEDLARQLAFSNALGIVGYLSVDHDFGSYSGTILATNKDVVSIPNPENVESSLERELAPLGLVVFDTVYSSDAGMPRDKLIEKACKQAFHDKFSGIVMHVLRLPSEDPVERGYDLTIYKKI